MLLDYLVFGRVDQTDFKLLARSNGGPEKTETHAVGVNKLAREIAINWWGTTPRDYRIGDPAYGVFDASASLGKILVFRAVDAKDTSGTYHSYGPMRCILAIDPEVFQIMGCNPFHLWRVVDDSCPRVSEIIEHHDFAAEIDPHAVPTRDLTEIDINQRLKEAFLGVNSKRYELTQNSERINQKLEKLILLAPENQLLGRSYCTFSFTKKGMLAGGIQLDFCGIHSSNAGTSEIKSVFGELWENAVEGKQREPTNFEKEKLNALDSSVKDTASEVARIGKTISQLNAKVIALEGSLSETRTSIARLGEAESMDPHEEPLQDLRQDTSFFSDPSKNVLLPVAAITFLVVALVIGQLVSHKRSISSLTKDVSPLSEILTGTIAPRVNELGTRVAGIEEDVLNLETLFLNEDGSYESINTHSERLNERISRLEESLIREIETTAGEFRTQVRAEDGPFVELIERQLEDLSEGFSVELQLIREELEQHRGNHFDFRPQPSFSLDPEFFRIGIDDLEFQQE